MEITIFIAAGVLDDKRYEANMCIMFPAIVLCCSKYIHAMLGLPNICHKKGDTSHLLYTVTNSLVTFFWILHSYLQMGFCLLLNRTPYTEKYELAHRLV